MARMGTCDWYNIQVEDIIAHLEANDEMFFCKTFRNAYNLKNSSRPQLV